MLALIGFAAALPGVRRLMTGSVLPAVRHSMAGCRGPGRRRAGPAPWRPPRAGAVRERAAALAGTRHLVHIDANLTRQPPHAGVGAHGEQQLAPLIETLQDVRHKVLAEDRAGLLDLLQRDPSASQVVVASLFPALILTRAIFDYFLISRKTRTISI